MLLIINRKSKVTVFTQIYSQITELINNGTLDAGARLPSSRELAKTAEVNRTTVVRVYEELWAQGYIESTPVSYTTCISQSNEDEIEEGIKRLGKAIIAIN